MKKFSVAAIGILFLLACLYTPVFADSGHGHLAARAGAEKGNALSSLSAAFGDHIKEVYTALDPSQFGERYFYAGETIYFVGNIFLNNPGPYTVLTVVTDAVGKVLLIDSYSYDYPTFDTFWFYTDTLVSGTYKFNLIVTTANSILMSPEPFSFVVQ